MAAMRTVLCGFAVGATGLIVLAGQGGVFAAEGSNAVSVAMASRKVGSAAEAIAAVRAQTVSSQTSATDGADAPALPAMMTTVAATAAPPAASPAQISRPALSMQPSSALDVAAPQIPPIAAVVPTPQSKPDFTGSTVRRPEATERVIERPEPRARRTAAANRTRSLRPIAVTDDEAAERRPRRVLTIPLPAIIGAYR